MSVEHISFPFELEEEPQRSDTVVFIAGSGGTNKGIVPIETALEKVYGEGNVHVFNSLLSPEAQDPQKISKIAELIENNIADGVKTEVIVNSLGGVELYKTIQNIEKRNLEFFSDKDHLANINVTLISPVGFTEGIKSNFAFLGRLATFMHEETPTPIIGSMATERGGIASINTLPPRDIPRDELVEGLRGALSDISQYEEGFSEVNYSPARDNEEHLSDDDRDTLTDVDEKLHGAIQRRNDKGVREMLKKRGELLTPYTLQVFAGEYEDSDLPEGYRWTPAAILGTLQLLNDTISGKPVQKFDELRRAGMKVNFAIPEYDVIMPLQDIKAFFDSTEEAQENAVVMPVSTHNSFALTPDVLIDVIHKLKDTV